MKKLFRNILVLTLTFLVLLTSVASAELRCVGTGYSQYGYAIERLALRALPTTRSDELGTYRLEGSYVLLTGRAWDNANSIWWVRTEFYSNGRTVVGWTGKKRFDDNTYDFYGLPEYSDFTSSGGSSNTQSGGNVFGFVRGLAIDRLALREGPSTSTRELGTYYMSGSYITLLARHWDSVNEIWWVKVNFSSDGRNITGWTGVKRFDRSTFDLYSLPQQ